MTNPARLREMIAAIRKRFPMAIPQSVCCDECGLLCLPYAMDSPRQIPEDAIGLLLMGAMVLAVGNRDGRCVYRNESGWSYSSHAVTKCFMDADYGNSILESCFACFDHATK